MTLVFPNGERSPRTIRFIDMKKTPKPIKPTKPSNPKPLDGGSGQGGRPK